MYATVTKDLRAYTIENWDIDVCKRYCMAGDVVVERIRVRTGFDLSIRFRKPTLKFRFSRFGWEVFGTYINIDRSYGYKNGKIVYDPSERTAGNKEGR